MGADTLMTGDMALLGYYCTGTLLLISWSMKSVESIEEGVASSRRCRAKGRCDSHVLWSPLETSSFAWPPRTTRAGFGRSLPIWWINTGLCN